MEWISVNDRLPEVGVRVLCARTQTSMAGTRYLDQTVGYITGGSRWSCRMDWINVTHWMPLPEPPKE